MKIPMEKHPEQKENEVYLGNGNTKLEPFIKYKTLRIGEKAFDLYGDELTEEEQKVLRPHFCSVEESEELERYIRKWGNEIGIGLFNNRK